MKTYTRRQFLMVSAAAPSALGLLGLAPKSEAQERSAVTPLIILFLSGGISAKEFTNPDPAGTLAELRGPFGSIPTRTPGVHFCETFPLLARAQDKFALLRAIDAGSNDHEVASDRAMIEGGATLAQRVGNRATEGGVPFVYMTPNPGWTAFNNRVFRGNLAFTPQFDFGDRAFLPPEMERRDLTERRRLLEGLDSNVPTPSSERWDRFRQTAFELAQGGGDFFRALTLADEDRCRFGNTLTGDMALTAKQFIERGAGAVALYADPRVMTWDLHASIGRHMERESPELDRAAWVLIEDIASGRLNATLLIVSEFNRTPRINNMGGRDHWVQGNQAILCGSRVRSGVVHGRMNVHGQTMDGAVQQREQLGNTVLMACGLEVNPAAPKVREVLR